MDLSRFASRAEGAICEALFLLTKLMNGRWEPRSGGVRVDEAASGNGRARIDVVCWRRQRCRSGTGRNVQRLVCIQLQGRQRDGLLHRLSAESVQARRHPARSRLLPGHAPSGRQGSQRGQYDHRLPFKKDSQATLIIDGTEFALFTKGDGAWSDSKDATIVAAMKKGKAMQVKGTSQRGTATVDTYSLAGVQAAMDKIDDLCK